MAIATTSDTLTVAKMQLFLETIFAKMGAGDNVNAALAGMMRQLARTMMSQIAKGEPGQVDGLLGWLANAVDKVRDPEFSVEDLKAWLST